MKLLIFLFLFTPLFLSAEQTDMVQLAKSLNLFPASKAIVQWQRIFNSSHKMKKYKINTLTNKEKKMLQEYLLKHAIDSDQPTIAGV